MTKHLWSHLSINKINNTKPIFQSITWLITYNQPTLKARHKKQSIQHVKVVWSRRLDWHNHNMYWKCFETLSNNKGWYTVCCGLYQCFFCGLPKMNVKWKYFWLNDKGEKKVYRAMISKALCYMSTNPGSSIPYSRIMEEFTQLEMFIPKNTDVFYHFFYFLNKLNQAWKKKS